MKARICLTVGSKEDKEYITLDLERIPNIGECISLGEKRAYRVIMVTTKVNQNNKVPYEIFAKKIDSAKDMLKAL